jgi:hypothetical protein
MLNEVKHLGNERNQRLFSCSAQILRYAQDDRARVWHHHWSRSHGDLRKPVGHHVPPYDEEVAIEVGGSGKAEGFADGEWANHRQAALAAATRKQDARREKLSCSRY